MRILITTSGHAGHVLPLVPFARAWERAGHEVRLAAPGSRTGDITRAGLVALPLADAPEDETRPIFEPTLELTPDEANDVVIGQIFGRIDTRAALPGVLGIVERWRPNLIVRESYELAGYLAAELRGIPHLRVAAGLGLMEERLIRTVAPVVDELRAELGLQPDPAALRIRRSPYLTRTPHALEDPHVSMPPSTHRFRDVGAPAPAAAAALRRWWANPADPLVYVSFGSVAARAGFFPGLYRAAAETLAPLPVRVLMTVGNDSDPAELGPLPPNVQAERWVPQADVTAHASAMVGHGGYGSTLGALLDGLPQVLVPLFADQPYNAQRVAELGAGLVAGVVRPLGAALDDPAGTVSGLAAAVEQVLDDPRYRRVARGVAREAAQLQPVVASANLLGVRTGPYVAAA